MGDGVLKYIGTGVVAIICYVVISNTLWLLLGSKILQSLPGVNIRGATGTLRIAIMVVATIIAFLIWIIRYPLSLIGVINKSSLSKIVSTSLQSASRFFRKL